MAIEQEDPTANLSPGDLQRLYDSALEQSFKYAAAGSAFSTYQTILSRIDRFGNQPIPPNHEVAGLTFITRPKLNLMTTSLRQDRILATLDTNHNVSLPFAMRCLLDTNFSKLRSIRGLAAQCPFFNDESPFIIPLTNCLTSISGWPDFNIDVETSEGGFFSEDFTMARGSDMLNRSYDLTLTFRDIQGGFVAALFLYWLRYMALVKRGVVTAYPEDIAARRLNYTCSIYRFVLDPSRRFITKWAKATGCFPKSFPIGSFFNIGERESFLSSTATFSVPFQVNKVEYMDPIIFRDFNTLVERYATGYTSGRANVVSTNVSHHNFAGTPHIDTITGQNELKFYCYPEELENPTSAIINELEQRLLLQRAAQTGGVNV